MRFPKFNNWALLGHFLSFSGSFAEAYGNEAMAGTALVLAVIAYGMWFYTGRKARNG